MHRPKTPSEDATGRLDIRTLRLGALLVLVTLAAYGNSFHGAFLFDDTSSILENRNIQALAHGDFRGWALLRQRPVGQASLALNYAIGGKDALGYHIVNLLVHLAAGLFLFGLVRRTLMLSLHAAGDCRKANHWAFAIALVWLVHPLQTESVTYIVQRFESMMGMFYLACLYFVVRSASASRFWPWQTAAVLACWLGMGTKEVMVTAPLVMLLYDRIFLADTWHTVVRRRGLMYAMFLPAMVWLAASTARTLAQPDAVSAGFGVPGISWFEYLGSQGGVILHYLRLAILPHPLCLDYQWPIARGPLAILLPGAVIVALLAACVIALRTRPRLGFLGLSFFLILAPTSSIMPLADLASEHRMYLPLAPVVILVVLGVGALVGRCVEGAHAQRNLLAAALAIVSLALAARTFGRNGDYSSPIAMWQNVLATVPDNPRAHYNLGVELKKVDQPVEAADHYERAVKLSPGYADAHTNLGILLIQQGKVDEAKEHFQIAVELKPDVAQGYNNLGNALVKLGEYDQAKTYLEHALQIDADYAEAHHNLGLLLAQQGDDRAAQAQFENAVRLKPNYADAHFNLGVLFGRRLEYDQAEFHLNEVLRIDPAYARAHVNLGNVFGARGDERRAAEHFRQALTLQPSLLAAAKNLVWILAAGADPTLRNGQEAVRWAEKSAAETHHNDPVVLDALAAAYAEAGRWDDAVATAAKAVGLASSRGQTDLARAITVRWQLYQSRQPYRIPSPP